MTVQKDFIKQVEAVNFLYEYTPQIVKKVKSKLDAFIGKPLFKADGSWRKSVNWEYETIKKQLPNGDWLNVSYSVRKPFSMSDYLSLDIKICLNGGSYENRTAFTIYQETGVVLYNLDKEDNIIDVDIDLDQWNERFDADELVRQSEVINAKVKELESEISKVHYRFRDGLYIPHIR